MHKRFRNSRGAYASRSCFGEDTFVQPKSRFFTVERSTCTKSGGRKPAVCRMGTGLQRTPNHVRRIAIAERRGAGVIPPWL